MAKLGELLKFAFTPVVGHTGTSLENAGKARLEKDPDTALKLRQQALNEIMNHTTGVLAVARGPDSRVKISKADHERRGLASIAKVIAEAQEDPEFRDRHPAAPQAKVRVGSVWEVIHQAAQIEAERKLGAPPPQSGTTIRQEAGLAIHNFLSGLVGGRQYPNPRQLYDSKRSGVEAEYTGQQHREIHNLAVEQINAAPSVKDMRFLNGTTRPIELDTGLQNRNGAIGKDLITGEIVYETSQGLVTQDEFDKILGQISFD